MIQRAELPTPGPLHHRAFGLLSLVSLLCALAYFANVVFQTYTYQIKHYGHAQVALALLLLVVLVASRRTVSARSISLVAFLVYLAWSFGSATVPVSDFLVNYWEKAAAFSAEPSARQWSYSLSPPTIAYYGVFIALLGKSYVATYAGSALAWALSAGLLVKALTNFGFEPRTAGLAGLIYALAPSTVAYSSVVSPEAVFNLLLLAAAYALSLAYRQREKSLAFVALSSGCFALLFLTRPVGLFFLLGAALFALSSFGPRAPGGGRRYAHLLLALGGPFAVVILFNAGVGYQALGEFRLNPHGGGAANLLNGTNYATKGTYSQDDMELAGFQGRNPVSWKEASANATRIALARISSDPVRFIRFALTDKVTSMWGSDTQGLYWSLQASPHLERIQSSGLYQAMARLTDAFYLLCLLSFVAALAFAAFRKVPAMLVMPWLLPLLVMAALHVFIETQGRYHIPFMPFIYSAAALMIGRLSARLSRSAAP
jgi:4-amino-4-deoxy-L-arabinose transferase-like glycosyltransferase